MGVSSLNALSGIGMACVIMICSGASGADRARALLTARDLCLGLGKYVNSPDPDAAISFDQGKFKVTAAKGGVTVLEDGITVAQMGKFDYSSYKECLQQMAAHLDIP